MRLDRQMSKPLKRVIIPFSVNDLQTVEDYQHEHKIKSRSEAIRCLIRSGAAKGKTEQQAGLATAILVLRANRNELAALGVLHAAVFGSVATGTADQDSDTDILIEFEESRLPDIFEYAGVCQRIKEIIPTADVVERGSLRSKFAKRITNEAVYAF
jgi:predicted nucleotidyltransferase